MNTTDINWVLSEEVPGYYPQIVADSWNTAIANRFFKQMGMQSRLSNLLTIYKNNSCGLWLPGDQSASLAEEILQFILHRPDWTEKYLKEVTLAQAKLYLEARKLPQIKVSKLDKDDLLKLYNHYFRIYEKTHAYHWIQTAVDFDSNHFSTYLLDYLNDRLTQSSQTAEEIFTILTSCEEDKRWHQQQQDLIKIYTTPHSLDSLKIHTRNYGWLGYGSTGPGWDMEYFKEIMAGWQRNNLNPTQLAKIRQDSRKHLTHLKQQYVQQLGIDPNHQRVFQFASDLIHTKNLRKNSMFYYFWAMEPLYRLIGHQSGLTLKQTRFLYPHEVGKENSLTILKQRPIRSLYLSTDIYANDLYLEGEQAAQQIKSLRFHKDHPKAVSKIYGTCANPGLARGEVFIVKNHRQILNFPANKVLVAPITDPNLVPAMRKAVAIVTDMGGITCHAAILAREMGIACITGTRFATSQLHNGDLVEVDATHGKLIIISRATVNPKSLT